MASVMTSVNSPAHGAYLESLAIRDDLPTLAEEMQRAGYYTIGLITNPNAGRPAGLDRGYDLVVETTALFSFFRGTLDGRSGAGMSSSNPSGTSEWIHAWLADTWPRLTDLPLFVYAHTNDPHRPNTARAPFSKIPGLERPGLRNDRLRKWSADYGSDVAAADHFFGKTMQLLESIGERDRTPVIIVADHGEEFREHGGMGHGTNLWLEQATVPVLVSAEGLSAGICEAPASLLDVAPTVLELAGIPRRAEHEGRSLLPAIRGEDDEAPARFLHLIEQQRRLESEPGSEPVGEVALLDDGWKLILRDYGEPDEPTLRLYDLAEDPGEEHDVSAEYPELAREMAQAALARWSEARGRAQKGARSAEMDAETEEILRALGYVD